MTVEHISESQLARYCGRSLGPHELLAVDRHLASCDICHERLSRLLPSALSRLQPVRPEPSPPLDDEPFHLDYDEHLVPYVDGTADEIDREMIESHISDCSACAGDLRDLQEFARQPAQAPTLDHSKVTPPSVRGTWLTWCWAGRRPATVLGIAALILCVAASGWWWATLPNQRPVEQAEQLPTPEAGGQAGTIDRRVEQPTEASVAPAEKTAGRLGPPTQGDSPESQGIEPRTAPAVVLNDGGGQVVLDERGHVEGLGALPSDLRRVLEMALTTKRLERPKVLAALSAGSGRFRSGDAGHVETFSLLGPAGIVTESDRPTFRWRPLVGASSYIVTVFDPEGRRIESSEPLTTTEWIPPRPLERGVIYVWQVGAAKDGKTVNAPRPPAPEARFGVLSRESATALQQVRTAHGSSHLTMGVWYWREGLAVEAEHEFEALARDNPNSVVADRLLKSLRTLRRL
jgi:hypothetical protein